jgi:CheY-like chemotaxis protein
MYEHALERLRAPDGAIALAVDYARDGVEALARLQRSPAIELVITDLYMPVMDGFSLVEQIRADPALVRTPVVAISAGGEEARERAIELGVDVYLQKPVKIADILSTVRTLLHIAA